MEAAKAIDAAYTWVDGGRPDYQELVREYSTTPRDLNPDRFRDTFALLRYSLRALERHAPWIRNVYLFTCRPQVPAWIRRDHPRLRIVHHDQVMPPGEVLPTFNSNVIESFLAGLPEISDRFLYLNDDYLLGAPVTLDDFVASDGRIRVFGTVAGETIRSRIYEHQVLSLGLLEHGPLFIDRRGWAAAMASAPAEIAELRRHRFRRRDDVRPDRLYRYHLLKHAPAEAVAEPFWRYLRKSVFHKIKPGLGRQKEGLDRIRKRRPKFICLNDDLGTHVDDAVVAAVQDFLDELLPGPSSFEADPAAPPGS